MLLTSLVLCLEVMSLSSNVNAAESAKPSIQVYAHRGARAFSPENTLPAYRTGLRSGADFIDMDVVLTKDGEVLVSHDPILNPDIVRLDGKFLFSSREALEFSKPALKDEYVAKYSVLRLELAELRKFDVGRLNPASRYSKFFPDQLAVDGTRMPTLTEVIHYGNRASGAKIGFQIEMKTQPGHPEFSADPAVFAKALHKILKKEGIVDRAEIQAFDFRCLQELRKLDRKVKTAFLTSRENEKGGAADFLASDPKVAGLWTGGALLKDYHGSIPQMVKEMGGFAWEPEDAELTQEALAEAKKLGLKVVVWSWPEKLGTAFDSALTAKMIDWGVDGIITDDPGRLTSMLAARGYRVPKRYESAP